MVPFRQSPQPGTLPGLALLASLSLALLAACAPGAAPASSSHSAAGPAGAAAGKPALVISGIPDQSAATLEQTFSSAANYLQKSTGLEVRYVPAADYAAIVTGFKRGDIHLGWFGGLTGVQARVAVPGARAVAQRPRDAEFHSRIVVGAGVQAQDLKDLKGLTFTFGSESSTSGHLMPRYFMLQAGLDPEKDLKGPPGFSGSHDKTYKLVESGAFQAGALNEAVWEQAVKEGKVDTSRVRVLFTTPAYYDYHWTVHPEVDSIFGAGTEGKLVAALLDLRADQGADEQKLLELFATDRFVPTSNENYRAIEEVAEQLGILR